MDCMKKSLMDERKWFSLIELLVVIILIAIISVIAWINFGNQTPNARNAMRLDSSSKIQTAFQVANIEEKISSSNCMTWSDTYTLTGTISWIWCHIVLDWSQDSKNFLKNIKITWTFQDPLNETVRNDDFIYEFNYKLWDKQNEFVYLTEPDKNTSFLNTYALNYSSGSLNQLNIDWNYSSIEKSISPIYLKDTNWTVFSEIQQAIETDNSSWKTVITSFTNSAGLKNKLASLSNVKYNWRVTVNLSWNWWSSSNVVDDWKTFCRPWTYSINWINFVINQWVSIWWITNWFLNQQIQINWNQVWSYWKNGTFECKKVDWVTKFVPVWTITEFWNCWSSDYLFIKNSNTCELKSSFSANDYCEWWVDWYTANTPIMLWQTWTVTKSFQLSSNWNWIGWYSWNASATCSDINWTPTLSIVSSTITENIQCWDQNYVANSVLDICQPISELSSTDYCPTQVVQYNGIWYNTSAMKVWDKGYWWVGIWIDSWNLNYQTQFECKVVNDTSTFVAVSWTERMLGSCWDSNNYYFDNTSKSCKVIPKQSCLAWTIQSAMFSWKTLSYNASNHGEQQTITWTVNVENWTELQTSILTCNDWTETIVSENKSLTCSEWFMKENDACIPLNTDPISSSYIFLTESWYPANFWGISWANQVCKNEIINWKFQQMADWDSKVRAENIDYVDVKALICDSNNCNTLKANTTYTTNLLFGRTGRTIRYVTTDWAWSISDDKFFDEWPMNTWLNMGTTNSRWNFTPLHWNAEDTCQNYTSLDWNSSRIVWQFWWPNWFISQWGSSMSCSSYMKIACIVEPK